MEGAIDESATAAPPLPGVFLIRDEPERRHPRVMQAWFGLDGAALAARGVTKGLQVTSYKEGLRLGRTRFVARALDDRAGTTALLRAVQRIDPSSRPGRVIFTWSVHEEGGRLGASPWRRRRSRSDGNRMLTNVLS